MDPNNISVNLTISSSCIN